MEVPLAAAAVARGSGTRRADSTSQMDGEWFGGLDENVHTNKLYNVF